MDKQEETELIICCGGGIDSTALIHYYLDKTSRVKGVHFDYGQPSCDGERNATEAVAHFFDIFIAHSVIYPAISVESGSEYLGRNALFVLSALNYYSVSKGLVALGIHKGTNYYDSSPQFVSQMQFLLDGYYGGAVRLDVPFLEFLKRDIFEYCRKHSVPVELTFSCERNPAIPCGVCLSCLDRRAYDTN